MIENIWHFQNYLPCLIMESVIRSCECIFSLIWLEVLLLFWIFIDCSASGLHFESFATCGESQTIDSIRAREEICSFWINLNIFPTGMGPSTWNKLKLFFWHSFLCSALGSLQIHGCHSAASRILESTWILSSCSDITVALESSIKFATISLWFF